MTTMEEQLDELLAMAREAGSLSTHAHYAEHLADMGPRALNTRKAREARDLRKKATQAATKLANARVRFLAQHGGAP